MSHPLNANAALWVGIAFCIVQTALFSGLNLALFSVSRLRLEVEAAGGNADAAKVLGLRVNSNFTLATILWGNVGTNVLLTLLSESVLAGVGAFVFSTIVITLLGEIIPQAYFSRNAVRMAAQFAPFLKFYQLMLFAIAKPTELFLDWWLGPESIALLRERDFRVLLSKHMEAEGTDVGRLEATGAMNFLDLDDIAVMDEGEPVDPRSVIALPIKRGWPVLPVFEGTPSDPFLRRLDASGRKWVIFVDDSDAPHMVLNAHHFLRDVLFNEVSVGPEPYWHRPIVITNMRTRLGDVIGLMQTKPEHPGDDVIDHDLILVWGTQKRIITGADLLGRLLRGIAHGKSGKGEPLP
jgi:metal transporter CNNM